MPLLLLVKSNYSLLFHALGRPKSQPSPTVPTRQQRTLTGHCLLGAMHHPHPILRVLSDQSSYTAQSDNVHAPQSSKTRGPLPPSGNHRHPHNSRLAKNLGVQNPLAPWTEWPCSDINTQQVTFLGGGCHLTRAQTSSPMSVISKLSCQRPHSH